MRRIFTALLVIVVSTLSLPIAAQQVEWHKAFDASAVIDWQISQDHIYVTSENSLAKFDLDGNKIFEIDPEFNSKVTSKIITSSYVYISSRNQIHKSNANGDDSFQLDFENPVGTLSFVADEDNNLYVCWEDYTNIWLSKFNNDGEKLFEKKLFTTQDFNSRVHTMSIDGNNRIIISGFHAGTELSDGITSLTDLKTGKKAFLYSCDTDGEPLWLVSSDFKSAAQDHSFAAFNKINIDQENSIIVTGKFATKSSNEVIFGDNSFKTEGKEDGLIAKFNSTGQLVWIKAIQGNGTHNFDQLSFSGESSVLFTNYLTDEVQYDNETINQDGNNHIIMKISSEDGSLDWYKTFSKGPEFYNIPTFSTDSDGTIYLTGVGNDRWAVPFPGTTVIEEPYRGYIAKISNDGTLEGGSHLLGGKSFYNSISYHSGNIYFMNCIFDDITMYETSISAENSGDANFILGKLSDPGSVRMDENDEFTLVIYPNPASEKIRIDIPFEENETYVVNIFDIHGKMITSQLINQTDNQLNVSNLEQGMYMIQLTGNNKNISERLIKM